MNSSGSLLSLKQGQILVFRITSTTKTFPSSETDSLIRHPTLLVIGHPDVRNTFLTRFKHIIINLEYYTCDRTQEVIKSLARLVGISLIAHPVECEPPE